MPNHAKIKTQPTAISVQDFLATLEDSQQKADSLQLCQLFMQITHKQPVMWGPSIIGFGQYHYTYPSGHEGDMAAAGFSPRKTALTIYLADGVEKCTVLLGQLGSHKTGKACLYIKQLSDVNTVILKAIIEASYNNVVASEDAMHLS